MKHTLVALVSLTLLPAAGLAQCYRSSYVPYVAPVVVERVVVKEIYAATFIPILTVGYGGVPLASAAVPAPAPVLAPAPGAPVAGLPGVPVSAARGTATPEAFSDAQIDALLLRLEARLQAKQTGNPPVESAGAPASLPAGKSPEPAKTPEDSKPQSKATAPPGDIVAVLMKDRGIDPKKMKNCASCHMGNNPSTDLRIFSKAGVMATLSKGDKARVVLALSEADMPPSAKGDIHSAAAFTDQEMIVVKAWAKTN